MLSLIVGAMYYIREVTAALTSVRDEARDLAFMDLGAQLQGRGNAEF